MKFTTMNNTRLIVALLAAGAIGGAGVGAFNSLHTSAFAAYAPTAVTSSTAAVPMALPDFSQIT